MRNAMPGDSWETSPILVALVMDEQVLVSNTFLFGESGRGGRDGWVPTTAARLGGV
jgi:hypothetical protein